MTMTSPCSSVCKMDDTTGWCRGCYRTIEEIIAWGQGSEAFKAQVLAQFTSRHAIAQFPEAMEHPLLRVHQDEAGQ